MKAFLALFNSLYQISFLFATEPDGMVDELRLHVSPVIFGGGINVFEGIENLELELLESRPSTYALHLHYAVKRS